MKGEALRKITDGKTVKVEIWLDEELRISKLLISGDFFAVPIEAIDELESKASGKTLGELLDEARRTLERVELAGISVSDVVELISEAYKRALS